MFLSSSGKSWILVQLQNKLIKFQIEIHQANISLLLFFSDAFYIQFFQSAFPDIDFSSLEETNNEEEMAMNIQTLIDLLSQEILRYDLSHIRGDQIVSGNPEHCINLL